MQTRLLHFSAVPDTGAASRQGQSAAQWEGSSLKAVTTGRRAGYLRRNGVPVSADAVVTEYFHRHAAFDDQWITVTTIVNNPTYLAQEFITSSSFKKLEDDDDWTPTPCDER